MSRKRISVRVPATTANLGPGFDTLGVALSMYNWTTVELTEKKSKIPHPMVAEAIRAYFRAVRKRVVPCAVSVRGEVPISRGLGSSVTVRLGVAAGLNRLCREPLSRQQLLELVTQLEHHPDNAAPALLGGFVASAMIGSEVRTCRVKVSPRLKFVVVIPDVEIETAKARKVLPKRVTLWDAVSNVNRAALIAAAFASGEYDKLRNLFDDKFHQPYRARLLPPLFDVIRAGEKAGALGGWLSGSGSSIMCVTLRNATRVGKVMRSALAHAGVRSEVRVLTADNGGVAYH